MLEWLWWPCLRQQLPVEVVAVAVVVVVGSAPAAAPGACERAAWGRQAAGQTQQQRVEAPAQHAAAGAAVAELAVQDCCLGRPPLLQGALQVCCWQVAVRYLVARRACSGRSLPPGRCPRRWHRYRNCTQHAVLAARRHSSAASPQPGGPWLGSRLCQSVGGMGAAAGRRAARGCFCIALPPQRADLCCCSPVLPAAAMSVAEQLVVVVHATAAGCCCCSCAPVGHAAEGVMGRPPQRTPPAPSARPSCHWPARPARGCAQRRSGSAPRGPARSRRTGRRPPGSRP